MARKLSATEEKNPAGAKQKNHEDQSPQTDTAGEEFMAEGAGNPVLEDESSALPQTETENGGRLAEGGSFPQTETENGGPMAEDGENGSSAQTETELAEFTETQAEGTPDTPPDSQTETENAGFFAGDPNGSGSPQTDPDSAPFLEEMASSGQTEMEFASGEGSVGSVFGSIGSAPAPEDALPQTETENPLVSPDSAGFSPDTPPVPQTDPDNSSLTAGTPGDEEKQSQSGGDGDEAARAPAPRRRRSRTEPVLAIDEHRNVETVAEKLKGDLLDLVESQKGRKLLAGTIQGIERSADNPNLSFAVIYHGAFKVIIPAEETVLPPADFRDRSPADVMHYLITKRLGAEIDYLVKGVDVEAGIAAASRLQAMALKRRYYYFGTDRDGNNRIYEGLVAEARVVSVIRAGIFVDLFGLETYISLRELSYQRWIDATAHFQSGQRVLVKILALDRSDRDNLRVAASVKQAGENPYEAALKRYIPGNRYVGTVSLVDTNGVFVNLDGGIDCLCTYPPRGRPPRGARVTVRIIGANHETNRIWGAITHMTTAR